MITASVVSVGAGSGIPAIATQMKATVIKKHAHTLPLLLSCVITHSEKRRRKAR